MEKVTVYRKLPTEVFYEKYLLSKEEYRCASERIDNLAFMGPALFADGHAELPPPASSGEEREIDTTRQALELVGIHLTHAREVLLKPSVPVYIGNTFRLRSSFEPEEIALEINKTIPTSP